MSSGVYKKLAKARGVANGAGFLLQKLEAKFGDEFGEGMRTQVRQANRLWREEFANVRCADCAAVAATELEVFNRFPAAANFPRRGVAGRVGWGVNRICRITDTGFERQAADERSIFNQRRDDFCERFIHVVAAVDVRSSTTGAAEFTSLLRQ